MKEKNNKIIIKFSGEVMGQSRRETNLDFGRIRALSLVLKKLARQGYRVGVVIGGGNIFRARMVSGLELERKTADYMGMLATTINALALRSVLIKQGQPARVLSPMAWPAAWDLYSPTRARKLWSQGNVLIFAAGVGKPYFTTDTGLVLRAAELGVCRIFKATNVAGVYSSDPDRHSGAHLYKFLTYRQALQKKLRVMDASAFALANKHNMVLRVFKYSPSNVAKAVRGFNLGTVISHARG